MRKLSVYMVAVAVLVLLSTALVFGASLPYEIDFSREVDGTLPVGWYPISGDWQVMDGTLEGSFPPVPGDAQGAFIFIPDLLVDDFDMTMTIEFKSVSDSSRFGAIMIRSAAATGAPRHKFLLRQRASGSNGVGLLFRDSDKRSSWVQRTNLDHDFELDTPYRLRILAYGDRIKFLVNDTLALDGDATTYLQKGSIGFAVHGATVRFSDIRIDKIGEREFDSIR